MTPWRRGVRALLIPLPVLLAAGCLGGPAQVATGTPVATQVPRASGGTASVRPAAVSFVSATTGWVIGEAPCGRPPCTTVLQTRNGRTWKAVGAPPAAVVAATAKKPGVSQLVFANDRDGWAFGPDLWATHDGGKSWRRVDVAAQVLALDVAGDTAYALGRGCPPASTGCGADARVFRSAVRADEWKPLQGAITTTEGAQPQLVAAVGAAYLLDVAPLGGQLFALDGDQFVKRTTPCVDPNAGIFAVAVGASSGDDVVLVCAGSRSNGRYANPVHVSADAGSTWRERTDAPSQGRPSSVAAVNARTFVVALLGDHAGLAVTRDGGRTWSRLLTKPTDPADGLRYVHFTDERHGVALSGSLTNALLLTSDGGATWRRQPFAS